MDLLCGTARCLGKRRGCYGTDDENIDADKSPLKTVKATHEGVLRRLETQRQVDEISAVQCSYSAMSASQVDVVLIMVPADGNFTTAIAKENNKADEIQGQISQLSRLINLLGVKQIYIGALKMDHETAGYKQERYDEISNEMRSMLIKVEWKTVCIARNTTVFTISGWMSDELDFIAKNTPVFPISGWMSDIFCFIAKNTPVFPISGWMSDDLEFIAKNTPVPPISGSISDNLLRKSEDMAWRKGMTACVDAGEFHVDTLYDVLDKVHEVPSRPLPAPVRMPFSGIYEIKCVGDVLDEETLFASNPCTGKVCTVEMHHQCVDQTCPDDNVDLNFKGLDKNNMPRPGDQRFDTRLSQVTSLRGPQHQGPSEQHASIWRSPRGYNVAVDIKCLCKKSGRPSLRTTRRWWPAGVPAPRTSRRTWPAGAPAPRRTIPMTPTLMASITTQTSDLSHETSTSVETQTTPVAPSLMTSIATQTTDLSHETNTSVETQTMPITLTSMTSITTQTSDVSHETSISVETQTLPMTSTPMTSIATQTTDLSHGTSIPVETPRPSQSGESRRCAKTTGTRLTSPMRRISRRTMNCNRFLGVREIG